MMMMMMTFNVICDTWVLLLMLISCSVEWQGLGTLEKCSPLLGKGLYSFSQYWPHFQISSWIHTFSK